MQTTHGKICGSYNNVYNTLFWGGGGEFVRDPIGIGGET